MEGYRLTVTEIEGSIICPLHGFVQRSDENGTGDKGRLIKAVPKQLKDPDRLMDSSFVASELG